MEGRREVYQAEGAERMNADRFVDRIRDSFRGEVRFNEPMSKHTSLGIGGPADLMLFPEDPLSLRAALSAAVSGGIPVLVLGGGTNLLVSDKGVEGIVVSLREFNKIELTKQQDETTGVIFAGAGARLAAVMNFAQKHGLSGMESLAGIPGSIGGAVSMNAGSYGMEIGKLIESVTVMDMKGGLFVLRRDDMEFGYRSSSIPADRLILSANLKLLKSAPEEIQERMIEVLERKRESQPLNESSAGCVFRNPPDDSAGRLIEEAGCKGMSRGGIEVSQIHANYFINRGPAHCRDFVDLMNEVKMKVKEKSGIDLEPEVRLAGRNL
jgi:UDP-N-acetylmuramate dehydrogenase